MFKRFRFAIEPLLSQENSLAKAFGHSRFVYNYALNHSKGSKYKGFNKSCKYLTQLKKTNRFKWLNQVSSVSLQQSLRNLDIAYKNFFNSCKGKRKGRKINPPRFKSRKSKQSITFTKSGFKLVKNKLYLAKIGLVKVIWSRELPSQPTTVTIEKTKSGKYFASFVCEVDPKIYPKTNETIGIDLGIKDFAVLSNGEKISSPNPLRKNLRKLRKLQREYSRTESSSNRREKKRISLAKLHQHISNIRLDFLHKLTTRLIKENQFVALEDLNVGGMLKNRKLSRAISDLGLGKFREMLVSKAEEAHRIVKIISRWFPSSKQCNTCGNLNSKLTLSDREWTCECCKSKHDRDLNAARNILQEGLRLNKAAGGHSEAAMSKTLQNEHGETVKPSGLSHSESIDPEVSFSEVLTPFSDKTRLGAEASRKTLSLTWRGIPAALARGGCQPSSKSGRTA